MCFWGPDERKMFWETKSSSDKAQKSLVSAVAGARDCEELGPRSKEREQLLQSRRGSWWEERCSIWFGVLFSSQPSSHMLKLLPLTTVDPSVVWLTTRTTLEPTVTGEHQSIGTTQSSFGLGCIVGSSCLEAPLVICSRILKMYVCFDDPAIPSLGIGPKEIQKQPRKKKWVWECLS